MKLKDFLRTLSIDQKVEFARRCGTTLGHLRNVAGQHKTCAESLAINVERESFGAVTCEELCPGADWAYIRGARPRQRRAVAA